MDILFPSQYKKALHNRTKNSTIRISDEKGKYKVGRIYSAKSYSGNEWGVKVKITRVIRTTLKELTNYGIPKRSIQAILKRERMKNIDEVELVEFKIL